MSGLRGCLLPRLHKGQHLLERPVLDDLRHPRRAVVQVLRLVEQSRLPLHLFELRQLWPWLLIAAGRCGCSPPSRLERVWPALPG
jgi:hypothetical protein